MEKPKELNPKQREIYEKYKYIIGEYGTPIDRAVWIVGLADCIQEAYEQGRKEGWEEYKTTQYC